MSNSLHLNIYLLKESVKDYDQALKEPSGLVAITLKPQLNFEGKLYYRISKPNNVNWLGLLNVLTSEKIPDLMNQSNAAVLFIKSSNRLFAITFSFGRSLLKPDCFELNFGLITVLNAVDPDKLISVSVNKIEDNNLKTNSQSSKTSKLESFGLDISRDILNCVTGNPKDETFGILLSGSDSLTISLKMDLESLNNVLDNSLCYFQKTDYKERFGWVDNIQKVKDNEIKSRLDEKLLEMLNSRNFSNCYLSPPEVLDWENIEGFVFDDSVIHPVLDIDNYFNQTKPFKKVSLNKLKSDHVGVMYYGYEEPVKQWMIYKCLICETSDNQKNYILNRSEWFCIDNEYSNVVDEYVKTLVPKSKEYCLQDFNKSRVEEEFRKNKKDAKYTRWENTYNKIVVQDDKKFVLFDCNPFTENSNNTRKTIEVCDIFYSNRFYHIKRKQESATLSHLFAQGYNSAVEFLENPKFRSFLIDKTKGINAEAKCKTDVKPNPSEFEIVYAIITPKVEKWPISLPFFAKLNLMLNAKNIKRIGYKVYVIPIKEVD